MSDPELALACRSIRRGDLAKIAEEGNETTSVFFRRVVEECSPEEMYRLADMDALGRWANYLLYFGGSMLEPGWCDLLALIVPKKGGDAQLDYLYCFSRHVLSEELQRQVDECVAPKKPKSF